MIIANDEELARHRGPGLCARCGLFFERLDPHHTFVKTGMGSGSRLDVPENLAGVDRACHNILEHDTEENAAMAAHVARRETIRQKVEITPSAIIAWLRLILRTPKNRPMPDRPWEAEDARKYGEAPRPIGPRLAHDPHYDERRARGDALPGDDARRRSGGRDDSNSPNENHWREF